MKFQKYYRQLLVSVTLAIVGLSATIAFGQTKKEIEQQLMGHWQSSEATVEFRAKNVVLINGTSYQWSIIGKSLYLASDEGAIEIPYQLKGDVLTVWFDDRKIVYERISAEEAKRAGGSTSSNTGRGSSGGVAQDLVGKWCYSANVNASGGGRQSDICFTLKADGTYEYYGEASNSNVYGGSNSQSWDYGRWSATATTLTANSNSGKTTTYSLEKRNHPKTGDPMLMVDGDAFVTFYQRRPW